MPKPAALAALAILMATFACLSPAATSERSVTTQPTLSTEYPATSSLIHLYAPDCDAVYAQAMAVGTTSVAEPADQFYGTRLARITDPHNNRWSISTHIEDLTSDPAEMRNQFPKRECSAESLLRVGPPDRAAAQPPPEAASANSRSLELAAAAISVQNWAKLLDPLPAILQSFSYAGKILLLSQSLTLPQAD